MEAARTELANNDAATPPAAAAAAASAVGGRSNFFIPRLGLRARQVALLTFLVATIVAVLAVANIAYLTGSIITRTREQASQLTRQIRYTIQQDIEQIEVEALANPHAALAGNPISGTRRLMESQITTEGAASYLYITDGEGRMVTDRNGRNPLAANTHMIDQSYARPDLEKLATENAYVQIFHVFGSEPIYEYATSLTSDQSLSGKLHIGYSASLIRGELFEPILTYILIGLVAVLGAAFVAGISANILLHPLEVISSSIEKLESEPAAAEAVDHNNLPRDEMVTGVTARLKQLGARLADERSELEIMRGRLRQVIGHLEDRLLLLNRDGRVILASPDAEQILGLEEIEMTGLPIDETLGSNHPLLNLVERAFSERRTIQRTILHVPDHGKGKQLLASVQYIEDAGVPIGALISLRDYESFKKFESQWDVSKKLADLGRITSGIAHEVKNPLNAMVIHLEILRSKMETGAADPTPQIEILDSEIRRLDRVVQTFLNFTRPVEVRLEPLDLNLVVNQVVALAAMEAAERGVTINKELTPGELLVKGDSDLLKQALLNIIINGCQAMPEGGPLKISTVCVDGETAKIFVSDRGVGIPADARERIFNLYYTTKQGGTGIGLAQAFRALQLHNGSIRVESEVGVGTTFEISLPATT